MKKSILFLFFLGFCFITKAQVFAIAADANNIFYSGLDNPVTIAVEKYSHKSIIVTTDNGKITGSDGKYIFFTAKTGRADIILSVKINGRLKEVGRSSFRVKPIPDPIPKVGPSAGGFINKVVLRNQQFLRADYECCGFEAHAMIDSFTVCITRGDTCLYNEIKNTGGKFNEKVMYALSEIKKNDTVVFKEIFAKGPEGTQRVLTPILLFVTD